MGLVIVGLCFELSATAAAAQTATHVAASGWHTCALTTGGGVECWGYNYFGQLGDGTTTTRSTPTTVTGLGSGATMVTAGGNHTCALTTAGGVVCWGQGLSGQLGDGTTTSRLTPTAVSGLASGVMMVAAGDDQTCAVTTGGGVVCWGNNYSGQLGDGTTTTRSTPTAVSGLGSGATMVAVGGDHTCAVTTGGGVVCWGDNDFGQLGDGTTTQRLTPVAVSGLASGVTAVAVGHAHTCAVTTGGGVVCWGDNSYGQLGDGTRTGRLTPTAVSGLAGGVTAVAGGYAHSCAVTTGGGVVCWGDNSYGQLGDGTTTSRLTPTAVNGLASDVAAVALGGWHTCKPTAAGGVVCWGTNSIGQLGDGTTTSRLTPVVVRGLSSGVTAMAVGDAHSCAVTTGGGVVCWGYNYAGQLGDGTSTSRSMPTAVIGLASGATAVAAGGVHTCAVTDSGGVMCWGSNCSGQLGDGWQSQWSPPTAVIGLATRVTAVVAGDQHSCALTTGGGVVCWGDNSYGQLGDGTTTDRLTPTAVSGLGSGAVAVAAGDFHTCALTTGGGVVCWGWNAAGQLGNGTRTDRPAPTAVSGLGSGVAAVAAGPNHTCALTTTGGVLCWGYNWPTTPTAVSGLGSGVAAVAPGYRHTCALTTAGGVVCWGDNSYGQLGDGTTTSRLTPTAVSGLESGVMVVSVGVKHTCALTTAGGVVCWGSDDQAQLGLGTRFQTTTPVIVYGFGGGIAVGTIDPATGPTAGRTVVTITGAYFLQGATVSIGGTPATGVVVQNTETVLAIAPAHAPSSVDVVVRNPDGTTATMAGGFTYEGGAPSLGDFTGDGKRDVLWRHVTAGDTWLWSMDGATKTAETYVRTVADTEWEIRGLGDQSGDGKADILWRNKTTGMIYFWPMDGSTPTAEVYVGTVGPAYDIVGTGDFDGDGKSDILWRHMTLGDVWIWLMDGAAPKPAGQVYIDRVDPAYAVKGVGDLDADGKADIVWHGAAGDVWVWPMNGTTRLDQVWVGTVPDTGYQIQGVGDFTGDGRADILWWHAASGEVWLWTMNGTTRMAETWVATVPETDYRIVGTGDYDGNRKADILWHHLTRGEVWVWLMNGPIRLSETWVATVPDTGYQIVRAK